MSSLRPNIVPQRHVCNIGEVINSRYTIVSELGEGSFGHVYKVKDASGAVYALEGTIHPVSGEVFLIVPEKVKVLLSDEAKK